MEKQRSAAAASSCNGRQEAQHAQNKRRCCPLAAAGRHGGKEKLQRGLAMKFALPGCFTRKPEMEITKNNNPQASLQIF
jgi:hypothetical protein